jgi:glucose-1-phosphate adenylyltransferase
MKDVVAVILGGGQGTRLRPLTSYRSKPAVPLAGKYRLIDIPISNCINSGINQTYVLTQFLSVSLHRHIRGTYTFDNFSGGFVEILAAQQTHESGEEWYQGTADAVRKNLRYLTQHGVEYVLILSGDQLYRMDYGKMIQTHRETQADVTIAAKPVARSEASALGIMRVDDTGRVVGFLEKPKTAEEVEHVRTDPAWIDQHGVQSHGRDLLASMGIYLFNVQTLVDALELTDYRDFGREVFPASIRSRQVQVHLFDGYWEDIGTIRAFYEANLALAKRDAPFELNLPTAPIYTRARFLPPSRIDGASIEQSLVADGCEIGQGTRVTGSVVGLRCRIGSNVEIRDSVLMGADFYEGPDANLTPLSIGDGSVIRGAIVDKNCRIGPNVRVEPPQGCQDRNIDAQCVIRDGIVVVQKGATLPGGWRIPLPG